MRLGLIGDIHADIRALEATLRHLQALAVNEILCTGDLVGYGSQPDAVVAMVRELAIPCIRGNHDRWALERCQVIGLRGWKPAEFKSDTWDYLRSLPPAYARTIAGRSLAIHHGSPASDTEYVTPYQPMPESIERFWNEAAAEVLILGHSHLPMIERTARGTILNPGSVLGVPGVHTSYSFAVLELESLAVWIHDVRTGREIRRDPVFLDRG